VNKRTAEATPSYGAWNGNSAVTDPTDDGRMKPQSSERTGILILRLWIEVDANEGFRARITQTLDSAGPDQDMATAATPEDVYSAVKSWVETFVGAN
jgi:hypothetical protein